MMQQEELRLECLKLAASHLSCEPHNIETLLGCAKKFYDFVTEQPTQSTSDPETPYGVSYIAEAPSGAISREWLYEKLTNMLHEAEVSRAAATTLMRHQIAVGQCAALQEVIDLINPKNRKNNEKRIYTQFAREP